MQCRVIFKMQRTVVQCVLEFPQVGKCDLQYFTDNLQLQPFHQEQEDFPCQPIGKWHIRRPEPGQVAMSSVKLVAGMDKADVIHAVKMTPVLILSAGLHGCRFDCLCAKPSALLRHLRCCLARHPEVEGPGCIVDAELVCPPWCVHASRQSKIFCDLG